MQNDRLEYLFLRYYQKAATAQEREELMGLLQGQGNQPQIKHLIDTILRQRQNEQDLPKEAADEILSSIFAVAPGRNEEAKPRMLPVDSSPQGKPSGSWVRLLAAASVTGFLVLAGYQLYRDKPSQSEPPLSQRAVPEDLPPGGEKAQLTLWDGRVIDLETVSEEKLPPDAGLNIDTSRGELICHELNQQTGYNVLTTPLGGQYRVLLPDGSRAWLNAGSSLTFPRAFSEQKRLVEMSGEVYFEIDSDANRPFVVRLANPKTPGKATEITVLGTHFNVSSYPDEPLLRATLLEGSVEVRQGPLVKVLSPGQQAQIPQRTSGTQIQVQTVDTEEVIAWKEGRFEFNGSIRDIMRQIARWYAVEVQFEGDVGNKSFVGAISRKNNVSEVLKMLELTGNIRFIIEERKIIVRNAF